MGIEDEIYLKDEIRRKDMEIQSILKMLLTTTQKLDTISLFIHEDYPAEYQSVYDLVKKNKIYLDYKGIK